MGKGAAQDPGTLLAGAGRGDFSDECLKAMAACNIDPADIGTYESQLKRTQDARDKVQAWKEAERTGDPSAYNARYPDGPPTASDYRLSRSQSAHLVQNAQMMQTGANRHDRCQNLVDGYSQNGAPAIALHRNLHQRQSAVERQIARERSAQQGLSHGQPRGATYHPSTRSADELRKCREMCADSARSRVHARAQADATRAQAAHNQMTQGDKAGDGKDADKVAPGKGEKKSPKASEQDIEKAAKCIHARMKQLEKDMKQKCADEADTNRAKANSPQHEAKVDELRQRTSDARQDHSDAVAARSRARRERAEALQRHQDAVAQNRPQSEIDQRRRELGAASRRVGQASQDVRSARHQVYQSEKAYYDAASTGCAAEQGRRIRGHRGNSHGRIPGGRYDGSGRASPREAPG